MLEGKSEQIGIIVVDSGQIQLNDPCNPEKAIVVRTTFGDGIYPVYMEYDEFDIPIGLSIPLISDVGMLLYEGIRAEKKKAKKLAKSKKTK